VSVQEENVKLKQVEQLIRDSKRFKTELATNSRNKWKFLAVQVDLNPEGAKDLV
jgi:hypothetical protein